MLVLDIETAGCDFDDLEETQKEYLMRFIERENDELKREQLTDDMHRYLSLYPYTAEIITIGMMNTKTENLLILLNSKEEKNWENEEQNITYRSMNEEMMLTSFWEYLSKAKGLITFNGKYFDLPFLMLRSAMLKIKPSSNLLGKRYDKKYHTDILEYLTATGSVRKFNLDFYCNAFGIESPKSKGITGMEVKELFRAGKIEDIAVYCGHDITATYSLYLHLKEYMLL